MSEFMGLIFGKYEAKVCQGFQSLFDSSKLSWVPCKNLENRIGTKMVLILKVLIVSVLFLEC